MLMAYHSSTEDNPPQALDTSCHDIIEVLLATYQENIACGQSGKSRVRACSEFGLAKRQRSNEEVHNPRRKRARKTQDCLPGSNQDTIEITNDDSINSDLLKEVEVATTNDENIEGDPQDSNDHEVIRDGDTASGSLNLDEEGNDDTNAAITNASEKDCKLVDSFIKKIRSGLSRIDETYVVLNPLVKQPDGNFSPTNKKRNVTHPLHGNSAFGIRRTSSESMAENKPDIIHFLRFVSTEPALTFLKNSDVKQ